jgi:hypothetical protein
MPNIRLKRYTGAAWENVDVQTEWAQILNKPATFTPTSHTHGNLDNSGVITNTPSTISSGDAIMVSAATGAALQRTTLQFNSSGTSNYLRQDGTWATISGGGNVLTSGTITTNTIPFWASSTAIGSLATATYPSLTELSYVKGVTSALQTQINGKAATSHTHAVSDITSGNFLTQIFATTLATSTNSSSITVASGTERLWFFGSMSGFTTIRIMLPVNFVNIGNTETVIYRYVWNNGTSTFADNLTINRTSATAFNFAHSSGNSPWTFRVYSSQRL